MSGNILEQLPKYRHDNAPVMSLRSYFLGCYRGVILLVGIYKITNIDNNKVYIGQSVDIQVRWYNHKKELNRNKHGNSYLQNSWNLHGADKFKFDIIEECEISVLDEKEIYWIKYYNSTDPKYGYNLIDGGSGRSGYKLSENQK